MRRLFLASLCGLALAGCTIVIPLESRWQPAGPRRYTLAGVRHRAEVWHAGPIVGWTWRVVRIDTGAVVEAGTGRGGSEDRAKGQAEMALGRAEQ
jgi:hypothetical protein